MYQSPLLLGVRQPTDRDVNLTVRQLLYDLGDNTGNMVFTEALRTQVKNAKLTGYEFTTGDLHGRDCIVVAAANWLNDYSDFGWLADHLATTNLPVLIVGLGAQAPSASDIPKVPDGTLKLLRLADARGMEISARGEFTCEVLSRYGFKNSVPTGCPSLLLLKDTGTERAIPSRIDSRKLCIHSTRHLFDTKDVSTFGRSLYRQAYQHNIDLLLQSELADFYFALGRLQNSQITAQAAAVLEETYGTKDIASVASYLREHAKVFFTYTRLIEYLSERTFCFGTRVHGTIAALIAGTPAVLVCHDSRTTEMAASMRLPHVFEQSCSADTSFDTARYYNAKQMRDFYNFYPSYKENFRLFFERNGLSVNF